MVSSMLRPGVSTARRHEYLQQLYFAAEPVEAVLHHHLLTASQHGALMVLVLLCDIVTIHD